MKFFEVIRTDIDYYNGRELGTTVLKRSVNEEKVNEFVEEWEARWQENFDNKYTEYGHCWMDCKKNLTVLTHELEDC